MSNEIGIVIRAINKSAEGFNEAAKGADTLGERIKAATQKGQEGFDKVDIGAMGFRDTVTGVQDTMTGFQALMGQGSMASATLGDKLFVLGAGIGDLASGFANLIVPVAGSVAALSAQAATAEMSVGAMIAHKAATIASAAASGVMTAAQWLLNAAMNANPIMLTVVAIAALAAGLVYAYQHSETFRNIVQALGRIFTDVLWPALKAVGEFLADKLGPAFELVGNAVNKVWGWLGHLVGASDDAADSEEKLKDETEKAKKAAEDHADALKEESDKAQDAAGMQLDLSSALRRLAEATDNATKTIKENGKNTDINTEKGRENQAALEDIAKSANAAGKAIINAGGSQIDAGRKMDEGRQKFITAAKAAGYTAAEVENMTRKYFAIPSSVSTRLNAIDNISPRVAEVRARLIALSRMVLTVPLNAGAYGAGAYVYRAHGGIQGAASGGPRSGQTLVGEYGPEMIDLAPGSTVHTAGDTAAMLGGGGVGRLQIEWVGGEAGDEFLSWLRKNIRIRGGLSAALG